MKKRKYNPATGGRPFAAAIPLQWLLLWLLPLAAALPAGATTPTSPERQEFSRNIKREFNISANGEVALYNRYGKIDVKTWNNSQVSIEVNIIVRANTEKEAQDVFDRIRIDFFNDNNYVKAQTNIEPDNSSKWTSLFNWGGKSGSDYTINYTVMMPRSNRLDLNNRYGDSFVAALESSAKVDVKYGNFRLDGVRDNLSVTLGYGNGNVAYAKDVNAGISYGKMVFKDARNMQMETKYSQIVVDKGADLEIGSKYDNYSIGQVQSFKNSGKYDHIDIAAANNIAIASSYTDIKVGKLDNSADLDLAYGNLVIKSVPKNFSQIEVDGRYTDCTIDVDENTSFLLDANTSYAGIKYPPGLSVYKDIEKGASKTIEGYFGAKGAKSTIRVRLSYGGLKVR